LRGTYRNIRRSLRERAAPSPGAASAQAGVELCGEEGSFSVIKADVGSVGGHTKPCARMMATVESEVGAYNLPLYLAFADPMYCAGLMLPPMIKGFRFYVIDTDHAAGDSVIELDAPADGYRAAPRQ